MRISEIQEKVSPLFREYGVKHAALFGSVSRGEDNPESDVDILIKLGKPMGLIAYSRMIRKMEEKLGRKVDLVTEKSLNRHVKPYIIPELKTIYEE